MTLTVNTHLLSFIELVGTSCLYLPIFRPLAAIASEISIVFPFSYRKAKPNLNFLAFIASSFRVTEED